jgi:hypothetical protein
MPMVILLVICRRAKLITWLRSGKGKGEKGKEQVKCVISFAQVLIIDSQLFFHEELV